MIARQVRLQMELEQRSVKAVSARTSYASGLSLAKVWSPLLLVIVAIAYGLMVQGLQSPPPLPTGPLAAVTPPATQLDVEYTVRSLADLLANQGWQDEDWTPSQRHGTGIGYLAEPATFRFRIDNPSDQPLHQLIVVPAPFLDHIAPAAITQQGVKPLPVMGDHYPFNNRVYDLPQWVWPVTVAPNDSTLFLFEVRNSGPTMLPVSLQTPQSVVGSTATTLVWKAFVSGLLGFALLFNIMIVSLLRRPGLAWLSVLLISVILSQLIIEGFGPWLIWPDLPSANALLSVSLPLCLIAICQFTPHFIELPRRPTWILHSTALIAVVLMITTPFQLPFLGQGSLLALAVAAMIYILILVLRRFHSHVYARYYALAITAIFTGAIITTVRTVGLVPVNSLTNSAFFLGTAAGSLILTMGIGQLLLQERRRRLSAALKARQERQRRARLEADYDKLLITHRVTGLPNRAILEEQLDALHREGRGYTLFLVRLERFSEIEQSLGYRAAESLLNSYLKQLIDFLTGTYRDQLVSFHGQVLASIETVSHAFAILTHENDPTDEERWVPIQQWLEASFVDGRFAFNWNASAGVATSRQHGKNGSEVLSCASFAALNQDKTLTLYDSAVAEQQFRKQVLMLDLEHALRDGDIYLLYQPKVSVREQRVVAFEALIRWQHPEFGLVSPDQWIPLAEQVGAIHPVTLWALRQVCQDWPSLAQQYGEDLAVAVNISALDLSQRGFNQELLNILADQPLRPGNLILEITETSVMANTEQARDMIHRLSQAGFRIALDDFGTGHSSLGTLASFDLDELKIDRSFLADILDNPIRQRVFRTALELGEALQLDIVVEGVETEAVAGWLQQFPGLFGQGYYWGRPAEVRQISGNSR